MFERKKHAPPQKRIDCLIGAGTRSCGATSPSPAACASTAWCAAMSPRPTARPGTLVVSEQARVDGEIDVSHVVVNGTVNGPVHCQRLPRTAGEGQGRRRRRVPDAGDAPGRGGTGYAACTPNPAVPSVVELKRAGAESAAGCHAGDSRAKEQSTMNAMNEMPAPARLHRRAAAKVKSLIDEEGNPDLKLRVFVSRRRLLGLPVRVHLRRSQQRGRHRDGEERRHAADRPDELPVPGGRGDRLPGRPRRARSS